MIDVTTSDNRRRSVHIGIEEKAYEKIVSHLLDMYSNPCASAVKELVSVCMGEANIAGKGNESIKVMFSKDKTQPKYTVTVSVEGTGMSYDDLSRSVSSMSITGEEGLPFSSISAKAPLAAADELFIRSRKNGARESVAKISRSVASKGREEGGIGLRAEINEVEEGEEILPVGVTALSFEIGSIEATSAYRAAESCSLINKVFNGGGILVETDGTFPADDRARDNGWYCAPFNPRSFCRLLPISFNGASGWVYTRACRFTSLMEKVERKTLAPGDITIVSEGTIFPSSGGMETRVAERASSLSSVDCVIVLPRGSFPAVPSFESLIVGDWLADLCRVVTEALDGTELGTDVTDDLVLSAVLEANSRNASRVSRHLSGGKSSPFMKEPPFAFLERSYGYRRRGGLEWDLETGKVVGKYCSTRLDLTSLNLIDAQAATGSCSYLSFGEAIESPLCLCFIPDMTCSARKTLIGHPMKPATGREGFSSRKGECLPLGIKSCTQASEYSAKAVKENNGITKEGEAWRSVLVPGLIASYMNASRAVIVAWSEKISIANIKKLLAGQLGNERSMTLLVMPKGVPSNEAPKLVERLKEIYGEDRVQAIPPSHLDALAEKNKKGRGVESTMAVVLKNSVVRKHLLLGSSQSFDEDKMSRDWRVYQDNAGEYCTVICRSFGKYAKAVDSGLCIADAIAATAPKSQNLCDKVIVIPAVNATQPVREALAASGIAALYDSETTDAEYSIDDYSVTRKFGSTTEIVAHIPLSICLEQSKCVSLVNMFCFDRTMDLFPLKAKRDLYIKPIRRLTKTAPARIISIAESLHKRKGQYVLDRNFMFLSRFAQAWTMIMGEELPKDIIESVDQIDAGTTFLAMNSDIIPQLVDEWINGEDGFQKAVRRFLAWGELASSVGLELPIAGLLNKDRQSGDDFIKNDSLIAEFMVSLGEEMGVFGELPESLTEIYGKVLLDEKTPRSIEEDEQGN